MYPREVDGYAFGMAAFVAFGGFELVIWVGDFGLGKFLLTVFPRVDGMGVGFGQG